ncbi:MAG: hypothetical protein ACRD9L_15225, partial [Bryobacteraceae bacterium]
IVLHSGVTGVLCLLLSSLSAFGQQKVDGRNRYERLLAIVPVVGKGTLTDPKRPMFAPPPFAMPAAKRTGILAYHYVLSDDGNSALVEFVAVNRSVFQSVFAGARPDSVKTFAPSSATPAQVEAEFQKLHKGFRFDQFILRLP